jgi:hypothetical protein
MKTEGGRQKTEASARPVSVLGPDSVATRLKLTVSQRELLPTSDF